MCEHCQALRARDRNIETVRIEQKVDPPRRVLATGAGHRVEDDGGFLPLEPVDRSDTYAFGNPIADATHREVVRRDDQDVVRFELVAFPLVVEPDCLEQQVMACRGDDGSLFRGRLASAVVFDLDGSETGAGQWPNPGLETSSRTRRSRLEKGVVAALRHERGDIWVHAPGLSQKHTVIVCDRA